MGGGIIPERAHSETGKRENDEPDTRKCEGAPKRCTVTGPKKPHQRGERRTGDKKNNVVE
jgi:hypothetical protein